MTVRRNGVRGRLRSLLLGEGIFNNIITLEAVLLHTVESLADSAMTINTDQWFSFHSERCRAAEAGSLE